MVYCAKECKKETEGIDDLHIVAACPEYLGIDCILK